MPRRKGNARKKANSKKKSITELKEKLTVEMGALFRELQLPPMSETLLADINTAVFDGMSQEGLRQILVESGVADVNNTLRIIVGLVTDADDDVIEGIAQEMHELTSQTSDPPKQKAEEETEKVNLTVHEEGIPQTVMVVQKNSKGPTVRTHKVSGTKGTTGTKVHAPSVEGLNGTLGVDLGGMTRLPKPRSVQDINELKWAQSRQMALKEITEEFDIPVDPEDYYETMCTVGKQALIAVVHNKTQAIYDAIMANLVKRQNKKKPKGKAEGKR